MAYDSGVAKTIIKRRTKRLFIESEAKVITRNNIKKFTDANKIDSRQFQPALNDLAKDKFISKEKWSHGPGRPVIAYRRSDEATT